MDDNKNNTAETVQIFYMYEVPSNISNEVDVDSRLVEIPKNVFDQLQELPNLDEGTKVVSHSKFTKDSTLNTAGCIAGLVMTCIGLAAIAGVSIYKYHKIKKSKE